MAEAPIKRALISVTDKTGIVEFAQALTKEIIPVMLQMQRTMVSA